MKTKNYLAVYAMLAIIVIEIVAIILVNDKSSTAIETVFVAETVSADISDEDMKIIMENAPEGAFSINEEYEKLLKQRERERETTLNRERKIVIDLVDMDIVTENAENVEDTEQETEETEVVGHSPYRGIELGDEEFAEFCRMVEAEVTGDSPDHFRCHPTELQIWWAKLRCARCILNRIASPEFPDDMHSVLFQPGQFAPVSDGRYYHVQVTDMTINACRAALDSTQHDDVPDVLFFRMGHWTSKAAKEHFIKTDALGISYYSEI